MNYKTIIATFGVLSLIACNGPDSNNMDTYPADHQMVEPETNPTPGQQLDTAIDQTKEAARDAKNGIQEFGDDVKEKTKNTADDIKQGAEDAKENTQKDINIIKEKSQEAKEEIKNN